MIAYGAGGSLETVNGRGSSPIGMYLQEQTVESIVDGILRFEAADTLGSFDPPRHLPLGSGVCNAYIPPRMRGFILAKVSEAASAMIEEPLVQTS